MAINAAGDLHIDLNRSVMIGDKTSDALYVPGLLNVHVQRLRAKVEEDADNPQVVLTVRGVGYKAGTSQA